MLIAQQHPDDPLSISQNDMALRKTLITEVLQAAFYLSMAVVLSVCETFSTSFGWERVRAPINNLVKSEAAVKLLAAIIQPHKLDEVRKALSAIGVRGIAVSEVRGFGRQKGHTEAYRGVEYSVDFLPKVKIEAAIEVGLLDRAIEAIEKTASTGRIGDGKIFVFELDQLIRIRTGETGADAL